MSENPKPTKRKRQPRPRLSIHSEYPENAALTITTKKGNDRLYIERYMPERELVRKEG